MTLKVYMYMTEIILFYILDQIFMQGSYGPGNPGEYLNFSRAFSSTGKSFKMVRGPGKSWKSVNSCNKVFLKDTEEQPDGKIQQLINT